MPRHICPTLSGSPLHGSFLSERRPRDYVIDCGVPAGLSAHQAPETISERLIALLPRRISSDIASSKTLFGAGEATKFQVGIYMYMVFFVFMLVAQWIAASQHLPAHDDARTPASITLSPQTPPTNYGQ